jgi:hypothetical protein
MSDTNVQLIKGSGTVLRYSNKDPNTGYYDPQDRDRNALQRAADGTWIETQPAIKVSWHVGILASWAERVRDFNINDLRLEASAASFARR